MSEEQQERRILPLDEIYLADRTADYKLYSLFQSMSYLNKDRVRFVYKKHDSYGSLTQKKIAELYNSRCIDKKEKLGLSTIQKKLRFFKSIGMMSEEFVIDQFGKRVPAYVLLENYSTFQYIPLETLTYLADTASSSVIKIYAYLLNKHIWKQLTNEYYSFTLAELAIQIGLKDHNNGNTRIVKNCLNSLMSIDLIDFVQFYQLTSEGMPTPRLRLVSANQHHRKLIK